MRSWQLLVFLAALPVRDLREWSPPEEMVTARSATLPLRFEENQGQWDPRLRFRARQGLATFFITDDGMTFARGESAVAIALAGAKATVPRGEDPLATKSHFFVGEPSKWRTNVPSYAKVRAKDCLPGVDLVWHGGGPSGLEYDVEVAAGVDATALELVVDTKGTVDIDERGALAITMPLGTLVQNPAHVVQAGRTLPARYVRSERGARLALDGYDPKQPVLIDPVLVYSTYLGGSAFDQAFAMTIDGSGNAYVTGVTASANFPTKAPLQSTNSEDAFVAKLDATGSALVFATYLGGSGFEAGSGIAIDGSGNVYVTGETDSKDFPTKGPYQSMLAGNQDVFVSKLDANGSALAYSTYLGGSDRDGPAGIAVDGTGSAYLGGLTASSNFPTQNPFQATYGGGVDAFVTKLDATGASLAYSTYLGGSGLEGRSSRSRSTAETRTSVAAPAPPIFRRRMRFNRRFAAWTTRSSPS